MDIQHEENGHKGAFFIEKDGERAADMTYSLAGDTKMIIDHTGVSETLRGTGAGLKLLHAAIGFAREKQLSVIPLCPFAKTMMQRYPEFQDVL